MGAHWDQEENITDVSNALLFQQANHISEGIRQGEELGRMRCIPTNPDKDVWVLIENQKRYVRQAGLHNLAAIDRMVIDHALITASIERWRPETNSFHLPSGEATITLEDVAYIYGLPVDGPIVTGRTFSGRYVEPLCQELLGIAPQKKQDYVGITIKFKWLEDNFSPAALELVGRKKHKDDEIRATRAYLFFLVSGQIFTQTSGARGPAYLLELFREFKSYAWAPACLANLYRMLAKATWWGEEKTTTEGKKKDERKNNTKHEEDSKSCRTPTGPLQLLQIWAYTRMQTIGRCPTEHKSWKKDIQFPLFKTWHRRLGEHPFTSSVSEVRHQLNTLSKDGFIWQPYNNYSKKFRLSVPKGDRDLFSSSTVLVWYWIVERHNTWRVMKQFGFKQLVPPLFNLPYLRRERIERVVVDYSKHMDEEVSASWAARRQLCIRGEECGTSVHSDEYFAWYSANTFPHIGKVGQNEVNEAEVRTHPPYPCVPQKYVEQFVARLERSVDRADRRKNGLSSLADSIRKKLMTIKAAFGTKFENFNMEDGNSSASDEDVQKQTKEKPPSGPSLKVSPQTDPKSDAGPSSTGRDEEVEYHDAATFETEPSKMAADTSYGSPGIVPTVVRLKVPALKSAKANTYQRKGKKRRGDATVEGHPSFVPPFVEVLDTPPLARALFDDTVSVHSDSAVVTAAPMASVMSLIWRIKRLPRMRKVPVKFSDYSHSMVHSGYVLNEQEQFLVQGFREYYSTKEYELASICTMVSSRDLRNTLDEGTWMDTNVMYYYFEILRAGCPTAFIADPSVSSWWQDGSTTSTEAAFGKQGQRVWESREAQTLVFVLHYRNHFTLVVGYVDEGRWEFYNSLPGDRLS